MTKRLLARVRGHCFLETGKTMASGGNLSSGYKLVPWASWEEWNFVRESLLSSSPDSIAAGLRRISAWRSRGRIPVEVDVTAAIVEIQQKDGFFREEFINGELISEDMLAMLYSMAIMRLVNGLVEHAQRKTGRSISDLADAMGIPRMLVDIRHESSHRDLPSLQLVRSASIEAIGWLKSNYWEPQRKAIRDPRDEIKSKLHEMVDCLRTRNTQCSSFQTKRKRSKKTHLSLCNKLSSQITAKLLSSRTDGSEKKISMFSKAISRLYSAYPSEVASVLLEFFQIHLSEYIVSDNEREQFDNSFSNKIDAEHLDNNDIEDPGSPVHSVDVLKAIVAILSRRRPKLLLSLLKSVLEMIEGKDSTSTTFANGQDCFLLSKNETEVFKNRHLCYLVPWFMTKLKELKDSGQIRLINETEDLLTTRNSVARVSLKKLLRKCLTLSVLGDRYLSDSTMLVTKMIGNSSLTKKIRKLPLPSSQDWVSAEQCALPNEESMFLHEEDSIRQAREKLEFLKMRLRDRNVKEPGPAEGNTTIVNNTWTVAKSWVPCPLGMLPCSLSSTAVLPVLSEAEKFTSEIMQVHNAEAQKDHENGEPRVTSETELEASESHVKSLKLASEGERLYCTEPTNPMEGRLFIDGVWKKVDDEELRAIQSKIRIFVQ